MEKMLIVILGMILAGCQSEVDKCLDAEMAGWDAQQERIIKKIEIEEKQKKETATSIKRIEVKPGENMNSKYLPDDFNPNSLGLNANAEKRDERRREEVIAERRYACLRAAKK